MTTWSKFENTWTGVSIPELLKRVSLKPNVMIHSYGGYHQPIAGRPQPSENLLAHTHNGELTRDHGWPVRLVVPHLLLEER